MLKWAFFMPYTEGVFLDCIKFKKSFYSSIKSIIFARFLKLF